MNNVALLFHVSKMNGGGSIFPIQKPRPDFSFAPKVTESKNSINSKCLELESLNFHSFAKKRK